MKLAKGKPDPDLWERFGWIVESVARRHRFTVGLILSYARDPRVDAARRDTYTCLWCSGLTYSEIGRMLCRDHTSIMAGVRKELAA